MIYSDECGFLYQEDDKGERRFAVAWMDDGGCLPLVRAEYPVLPEVRVYEIGWDSETAPKNWVLP